MYDWPETSAALDALWLQIRVELQQVGIDAPQALQHVEKQMPLWSSPDLMIGQTCGWPYANQLRGRVVPFARFDYGLEGCPAGMYQSIYIGQSPQDARFIATASGLNGLEKVAVNGDDSQSGFHVFSEISGKAAALSIPPAKRVISGAHRNSIKLVADGAAQIAAIDAIAFALAKRYDPETVGKVSILGTSEAKPGLPLITSLKFETRTDELYHAVKRSVQKLEPDTLNTLMIKDVVPARDQEYSVFAKTS